MFKKPTFIDVCFLCFFTFFITLHPFFLQGHLNLYELGIYLPGIQAILEGQVPYRDFFYLRGPFELYFPAFFMSIFGQKVSVLITLFYVCTVLTLFVYIFLAQRIYKTRLVLYLMVPVFVARVFPRVVFTFWGGFRYLVGALSLFCLIEFLRKRKTGWLFFSGILAAGSLLTSIEVGVSAIMAFMAVFMTVFLLKDFNKKDFFKKSLVYFLGMGIVLLPYCAYLMTHQAWVPFLDVLGTILTNMQKTYNPETFIRMPKHLGEFLILLINPNHAEFDRYTPVYTYVIFWGFLIFGIKSIWAERNKGQWTKRWGISNSDPFLILSLAALGTYGTIFLVAAFRNIQTSAFEMALQPEKIILFFLLEVFLLELLKRRAELKQGTLPVSFLGWPAKIKLKFVLMNALFVAIIFSSAGYAIQRYSHRFFTFKFLRNTILGKGTNQLEPLGDQKKITLGYSVLEGLTIPAGQAEDLKEIEIFIEENTSSEDPLLFFSQLGIFHFLYDRPFINRFPMVTDTWMNEQWHNEFMGDLERVSPKFVILEDPASPWFEKLSSAVEGNRKKTEEVLNYVYQNYIPIKKTSSYLIYKRKEMAKGRE